MRSGGPESAREMMEAVTRKRLGACGERGGRSCVCVCVPMMVGVQFTGAVWMHSRGMLPDERRAAGAAGAASTRKRTECHTAHRRYAYTPLPPSSAVAAARHGAAGAVRLRRQVDGRVGVEKAARRERESGAHRRLHRKVLRARQVVQSEHVPQHHIGVFQVAILLDKVGDTAGTARVVHKLAAGVSLLGVVRGHPEVVVDEAGARTGEAVRFEERRQRVRRLEFVGDRFADAIQSVRLAAQRHLIDVIRVAVRVVLVRLGAGVAFGDRVGIAVHAHVQACTEVVLVNLPLDAGRHLRSVLGRLARQTADRVDDAGGLHFKLDRAVLSQVPVRRVLVVAHRRDGGYDQATTATRLRAVGAKVPVFPQHAGVLLVDADGVPNGQHLAAHGAQVRIQIGDVAETVASEAQRVGQLAQAVLANIKHILPVVERRARRAQNSAPRAAPPPTAAAAAESGCASRPRTGARPSGWASSASRPPAALCVPECPPPHRDPRWGAHTGCRGRACAPSRTRATSGGPPRPARQSCPPTTGRCTPDSCQ
eukprot:ctg_1755.g494